MAHIKRLIQFNILVAMILTSGILVGTRALEQLDLPPGVGPKMRHGGEIHQMVHGLRAPLTAGDRFALEFRFERGGEREVTVWVQQPRDASTPGHHH